jgi:hypothetical protein
MKRLLIAVFPLFYAAFVACLPAVHTSVWAHDIVAGAASHSPIARAYSPHSSQTRSVEHPFVMSHVGTESPLIVAEPYTGTPSLEQFAGYTSQCIQWRAPPVLT